MKIIFFGSTNLSLAVLEALRKQHEILAVVTTPDAKAGRKQLDQETPVSALAKDLNLQTFKPQNLNNNSEFFSALKNLNADLFVVAAYGKILPAEYINLPKFKTLNAHPSMLPKYRGPSPIRTPLLNGDEYTGVSFILLDEQVDHGPLLSQQVVKIDIDDNDFMLTNKLGKIAAEMINQVIAGYASGSITPLPQDHAAATFTKIITKEDGKIDWTRSAHEVYNQFRAFYPWPGVWTTWNGKKIKITACIPIEGVSSRPFPAGVVDEDGAVVCGHKTKLKINRLQLEGKAETDILSFLNGYKNFMGSELQV